LWPPKIVNRFLLAFLYVTDAKHAQNHVDSTSTWRPPLRDLILPVLNKLYWVTLNPTTITSSSWTCRLHATARHGLSKHKYIDWSYKFSLISYQCHLQTQLDFLKDSGYDVELGIWNNSIPSQITF